MKIRTSLTTYFANIHIVGIIYNEGLSIHKTRLVMVMLSSVPEVLGLFTLLVTTAAIVQGVEVCLLFLSIWLYYILLKRL